MRFHFIVVLVLLTFATATSAKSDVQNSETFDSNHKVVDDKARHGLKLREGRKLPVENEERGIWTSPNNFVSKLTSRMKAKNVAGVTKTDKLSDAQVKAVTKAVAIEVNKNPKAWPVIKNGLKILFGTALFALIAAGVFMMVRAARNYQ